MSARPPIRVLGSIEIDAGETTSAIGARQHVLLAALVAHAGTVVSVDVLAQALWDDAAPVDPSGAVHTLVSRLRPRLPAGALQTRAPGYVLAADASLLDVVRFEELVASSHGRAPSEALPLLDEAVALCRGPAFGSAADRAVVQLRAIELDELAVLAQERRAAALIEVGRAADAVVALEALVVEHQLREESVGLLMEALARSGRHGEALRRFTSFRERLAEETGLEPSPELRRMEERVLAGELGAADVAATEPTDAGFPLRLRVGSVERRPGQPIAHASFGSGPPLVFLPGWLSNLEAMADGTDPRAVLVERLAHDFTVTIFDRYGTGLSAATEVDASLEGSVDEVRAVLDTVEEGATVLASSAAGPAALAAAAGSAEVRRLVLLCTYASGPALFVNATAQQSLVELVERSWGMGSRVIADLVVPGIDAITRSSFARFQRRTARPDVAADYLRQLYSADVSARLPAVDQPCLVLHYRDDPAIPYAGARQLAFGLSDAELVTLDGPFHTPPSADVERIATAVADFAERR